MHFGETRATALLAAVVALAILLVARIAPSGMTAPARETAATVADAEAERPDTDRPERPRAGGGSAGAGSALGGAIAGAGYSCPIVRRVAPIRARAGVYRIVCADTAQGAERSYRLDTRKGIATPLDAA